MTSKEKRKRKRSPHKTIDNKLDKVWSILVKHIAGFRCEYCGSKDKVLNSHHIYSRSNRSTRWELRNGVCLCVGHHTFSTKFSAHKTPTEFTEWLYKEKGEAWMTSLRTEAHAIAKLHLSDKEELYEKLVKLKLEYESRSKIK